MAAPTIALTAHEPSIKMGPCHVGYSLDDSTFNSGDGSLIDDCQFYWKLNGISGTDPANIPDRYMKVRDERLMSSAAFVVIAGSPVATIVDLRGGDEGRTRNMMIGYSQNYTLIEGSYSIDLTCENPSGESTTVSWGVVIEADTRSSATLGTSGRDYSDWSSAESWLAGGDSRKLIVDNDFDETVLGDGMFRIQRNYCLVETVDPVNGARSVMGHDDTVGNTQRLFEFAQGFEGSIIDGVNFAPSTRSAANDCKACRFRGNHCAIINGKVLNSPHVDAAHFRKPFYFDSGSQAMVCNSLINCEAAGSTTSGSYTVALGGTNDQDLIHIYGGDFGASVNESIFRTTVSGAGRVKNLKTMFGRYDNSATQSKSTIRYTYPTYSNIIGPYCIDGGVEIGSQTGSDGSLIENHITLDGVWSTGVSTAGANIDVRQDCSHVRLRNCYAGVNGISLGAGTQAGVNDLNDHVRAYNCTSEGLITSALDPTAVLLQGQEIQGCLVIAGGMKIETSAFAPGACDNNRVNGQLVADSINQTLLEWNALSAVGTDYEGETILGEYAYPSMEVESMPRLANNPNDGWGFDRASTTMIGFADGTLVQQVPEITDESPASTILTKPFPSQNLL